jgi:hypothetical protein
VILILPIQDADLDELFAFQAEPDFCRMAAFPPREREAYFAHTAKIELESSEPVENPNFGGPALLRYCLNAT